MSRKSVDCHLIVPGLFEGIAELASQSGLGSFPALEKYLSRGLKTSCRQDLPHLIAALLDIPVTPGRDVPTAAMMTLGRVPAQQSAPQSTRQHWAMATPVLLKPDRDRLVLHPAHVRQMPDELIKAISEHFSDQFQEILIAENGQWLIRLSENSDVVTAPLMKVIGMNVDQFLPEGNDRQQWHALMNEIQMLFHDLQTSQYGFNSLWFEGIGPLPDLSAVVQKSSWKIYGKSDLLEPFVKFTACQNPALTDIFKAREFESPIIVVQSEVMAAIEARSVDLWMQAMNQTEQLAADLLNKLKKKFIDKIRLYPLDGSVIELNRSKFRRFWLRPRPVSSFFDANQ